jgi:DNA-binding NarL/FixJ family response regulator
MASEIPLYRVLIVDDMPAVREALHYALEDERDLAVVGEAGDGVEAIQRAAELAPDVVILDIELPGLNGFAVTRALKAGAHPPVVVFLTVHSDLVSRQRGAEAGGDGFAEKAAGWPALIAEVHRVVEGRPPARSAATQ